MATSWMDALPRLFARRAAEEIARIYGVNGAKSLVAERLAQVDADEEPLYRDILAALDQMGHH